MFPQNHHSHNQFYENQYNSTFYGQENEASFENYQHQEIELPKTGIL